MEKTWMPTVAGILDIVAGALSLLGITFVLFGILLFGAMEGTGMPTEMPANLILGVIVVLAIFAIIADILAIVGGTFALRRRKWGMALTGSITAFFASWPLGIAAIVFTILAKKEFE